jgi:hypothetical protein
MHFSDPRFHMDDVLRQLSRELGAEYNAGEGPYTRMIRLGKHFTHSYGTVHARAGPWIISIGAYTREDERTTTQLYAPYVNPEAFRFTIARTGFLRNLGKKLGLLKDIDVGFPEFDEAFIINGKDEGRVRTLFADPKLRELVQAQPKFSMKVCDKPWPFAIGAEPYFPENVDMLVFDVHEAITDVGRLRATLDAFVAVLERLCLIGAARREPPGVEPWGLFGTAIPKRSRPHLSSMTDTPA